MSVSMLDDDGKAQIIKDRLGPSDYFGEMALLKDEPRMATVSRDGFLVVLFRFCRFARMPRPQVTATSVTICMKLDRTTFTSLLGENIGHDILTREAERRKREVRSTTSARVATHLRLVGFSFRKCDHARSGHSRFPSSAV